MRTPSPLLFSGLFFLAASCGIGVGGNENTGRKAEVIFTNDCDYNMTSFSSDGLLIGDGSLPRGSSLTTSVDLGTHEFAYDFTGGINLCERSCTGVFSVSVYDTLPKQIKATTNADLLWCEWSGIVSGECDYNTNCCPEGCL